MECSWASFCVFHSLCLPRMLLYASFLHSRQSVRCPHRNRSYAAASKQLVMASTQPHQLVCPQAVLNLYNPQCSTNSACAPALNHV